MFDIRCPKCQKKLAELGRKPIAYLSFSEICKCGKEVKANILASDSKGEITASLICPCGYQAKRNIGYLLIIKCKKCKTITKF